MLIFDIGCIENEFYEVGYSVYSRFDLEYPQIIGSCSIMKNKNENINEDAILKAIEEKHPRYHTYAIDYIKRIDLYNIGLDLDSPIIEYLK